MPFAFAHHFDMGGTLQATELYRQHFEPSPVLEAPYTIVSASVLCAETEERARWLANPGQIRRYGMRTGRMLPLLRPEDAALHPDVTAANAMASSRIVGAPEQVVAGLEQLANATGANELMLHTATHGLQERIDSLELVAAHWPALAPCCPR